MIQIALLGLTPVVVEEGLKKHIPERLHILHTKNEKTYKFEIEARRLKKKIEEQYKIAVKLVKVDAFEMEDTIRTILTIISNELSKDNTLTKRDFSINITGGTKMMVAAASTAAYLAGSRVYYVMESSKYRGEDLVKELPMPIRPEDDNRGNTSRTTAVILKKIKKLGKCTYKMLLEEVRKDPSLRKNQRIEYHLKKLLERNLISITIGWHSSRKNEKTGKPQIDYKKRTIQLTASGEYYAEFPDLIGTIV